jgi:hypothetical protein
MNFAHGAMFMLGAYLAYSISARLSQLLVKIWGACEANMAFEKRFNRKPTCIDADAYLAFELVHQAILKAGSTDVPAVRSALSGLKATTIIGDVEMCAADHQLLRPLIVVQATTAGEGKGRNRAPVHYRSRLDRAAGQSGVQNVAFPAARSTNLRMACGLYGAGA